MNPIPGRPPGPPYFNNGHPGGPPGGPFGPPQPPPPQFMNPNMLPPGWTEHKAPDGMSYYYNAASGKSSWIRPTMPIPVPGGAQIPPPPGLQQPMGNPFQQPLPGAPGVPGYPMNQPPMYPPGIAPPPGSIEANAATAAVETGTGKKSKKVKKEKAIKKTQILETPWFIVVTNLENTFFYNKETKTSIWVPTPELEQILIKMGQAETEKLEAERKAEEQERLLALKRPGENESGQNEKRAKNDGDSAMNGTEMTEDDVAWQLAMMEEDQDQHMQSQDEGEEEDDEDEQDEAMKERLRNLQGSGGASAPSASIPTGSSSKLEISPENIQEREMAFIDMMRDRGVSQFDTWDKALAKIERDPRMYLIPDKKERQDLFESYCVIRVREIAEAKEKESKKEAKKDGSRDDKERHSSRDSKSHSSSSTSSSKPEDVYRRLVEDYTTKTSTWLDFMTKYRVDPRFLGLKPGSLRETIFRKYLSDLKKGIIKPKTHTSSSPSSSTSKSSSSKKYKATEREIEEFMSLLRETKKDILHEHKNSSSVEWRKIKKLIDRDRRYDAVGSSTERELLFREYADRVIQKRD
ncbi:transcription elongation regulator [Entomortierella beljakovae]|nr:transcription elongation regulator [Entomortierella beljakovae]